MSRLFVAVWPSVDVRATLAESLAGVPARPGERRASPERWHITLRFLGVADRDPVVERLERAALPSVTAELGPRVELLGERVAVVPVGGLDDLAGAVRTTTAGLGRPDRLPYRGHLTVARIGPASSALVGRTVSATMRVEEVALVASVLGTDGPAYSTIARFATG